MKELTKKHILLSFNNLISEYPLEKITIEMIIAEGGFSKSTFYRHFLDKFDVMNYNYKEIVDYLFDRKDFHSWEELFRYLFHRIIRNSKRIKNSFSYFGKNSYYDFLYEYSYMKMLTVLTERRPNTPITVEETVAISHFCYGTLWCTQNWVYGAWDLSYEEMAKTITTQIPDFLEDIL